jgi:hypothetical protein
MTCHLCQKECPLCKSHVISEFIYNPFYDANHRFIEVTDVEKGKVRRGQTGYWERLLCSDCEQLLNRFEKHSRRLFTDPLLPYSHNSARIREFPRLDYRLLKLFFLSILWRASVSSLPTFEHVLLGPHEEHFRKMLLSEDAGTAEDYPTMFYIIHFDKKHFRDFMVDPTYMRVDGRKCYRLLLAGFLVLIFVASLPAPGSVPRLVLSPTMPIRGYDAELCEFAFLRDVWNRAAETKKDVNI